MSFDCRLDPLFGLDKDTSLYKRLILSHHKHLNQGAIIIDDRTKNGIESFSDSTFILELKLVRTGTLYYIY